MFTHPDRPAGGLFQSPKDTECSSVSTDFTWKLVLSPSFALVTTLEYEMAIMKNLPVWENFVAVTSPRSSNLLGDFSGSNSSPIVQETRKDSTQLTLMLVWNLFSLCSNLLQTFFFFCSHISLVKTLVTRTRKIYPGVGGGRIGEYTKVAIKLVVSCSG